MEIQEQQHGAVTVLVPRGPIVGDDSRDFRARVENVLAASLGRLVIDASAVSYVDSEALEALLGISEQLAASGQAFKISGANDTLREVFDLTDIGEYFEHFEDVTGAVRSFL